MRDILADVNRWQKDYTQIALAIVAEVMETNRKRDQVSAEREVVFHPTINY